VSQLAMMGRDYWWWLRDSCVRLSKIHVRRLVANGTARRPQCSTFHSTADRLSFFTLPAGMVINWEALWVGCPSWVRCWQVSRWLILSGMVNRGRVLARSLITAFISLWASAMLAPFDP